MLLQITSLIDRVNMARLTYLVHLILVFGGRHFTQWLAARPYSDSIWDKLLASF